MNNTIDRLNIDDAFYETEIPDEYFENRSDGKRNSHEIRAIIPGTISDIRVQEGERVGPGQVVLVLEAMKMFNDVETEIEGKVAEISVNVGDRVNKNQLMIRIES